MSCSTDQRPEQGRRDRNDRLLELLGPPLQTELRRNYCLSVLINCVTSVVRHAVIHADELRKRELAHFSMY